MSESKVGIICLLSNNKLWIDLEDEDGYRLENDSRLEWLKKDNENWALVKEVEINSPNTFTASYQTHINDENKRECFIEIERCYESGKPLPKVKHPFQKEILDDWVYNFINVFSKKYHQNVAIEFSGEEKQSFGNAFEVNLYGREYEISVFGYGFHINVGADIDTIISKIKDIIEDNRESFENIVRFCMCNRTPSVNNIDWSDITYENPNEMRIPGSLSFLDPENGLVKFPKENSEMTLYEYEKMMMSD